MATSFEPLAFGDAPRPGWIAALSDDSGFDVDPRFQEGIVGAAATDVDPAHDAQAEAYNKGFADGEAAALARQSEERQQTEQLKLALTKADATMREALETRLNHIVASLCEATVGPHFVDTARLQERCSKAVSLLDAVQTDCSLTLHPADIAKLDPEFAAGWTIAADETLELGTVHLSYGGSELVDGLQQWREAVAEAIGL